MKESNPLRLKYLFAIIILIGSAVAWTITYHAPGSLRNRFADSIELECGDIIWLAMVEIDAEPFYNFALVRTTLDGDTLWSKIYNGGAEAFCTRLEFDETGNILVFGQISKAPGLMEPFDLFLFCASPDGDSLWIEKYPSQMSDNVVNVLRVAEDTLAIVASSSDMEAPGELYYTNIVFVHENGDTIRTRLYGSGHERPTSAWIRSDSSIDIITKRWVYFDSSWTTLMHISGTGDSVWEVCIDSTTMSGADHPIGIAGDSAIFMAGYSNFNHGIVYGCDFHGSHFWKTPIPWVRAYTKLILYDGRSAILCGQKAGATADNIVLSWANFDGAIFREVSFPSDTNHLPYSIRQLSNGNLAISARASGLTAPSQIAIGILVDSLGNNVESNITEKPHTPASFSLSAHPNPFNGAVRIVVDCHSRESGNPEAVAVEIFDINGRCVAELPSNGTVGEALVASRNAANGDFPETGKREGTSPSPTPREFTWTPDESLPSGVYLVRARFDSAQRPDDGRGDLAPTGNAQAVKRVVYLK